MTILDTFAEKYSTENLVLTAVSASAEKRGLNLDKDSYLRVKIGKGSFGTEVGQELYNKPVVIFRATLDHLDYLIGVLESEPWEDNVFCTSDIVRVKHDSDAMFTVVTRGHTLFIAPEQTDDAPKDNA